MSDDPSDSGGAERRVLCLGLGYTARAFAARVTARGDAVSGTSRSAAGVEEICRLGWQGLQFDGQQRTGAVASSVALATHVLVSIPPDAAGDPVVRCLGADLAGARGIRWIGYLSTIGIYGDHGGGWVDETTLPNPGSERSRRRLGAETAWLELGARTGLRVEIFRLPGIYGPGRSAIDQVLAGSARRIDKPGQVFNRAHVGDIAMVLEAAMTKPPRHQLYNVSDDEPAPPQDVVAFAAQLLGRPPPLVPFSEAQLSPMGVSFYAESKRVSNQRMKQALGVELAFPTYREGLAAIASTATATGGEETAIGRARA